MSDSKVTVEALEKGFYFLSEQVNRLSSQVDNLSEVLATVMFCLEQGKLDFEEFSKNMPEIQARRMDKTLATMMENGLVEQLAEVEPNCSILTSGYKGEQKTTLRKGFNVTSVDNTGFIGKHIGDRVKVEGLEEEWEVLVVYRPSVSPKVNA